MNKPPEHLKARYVLLYIIPALLIGIMPLSVLWPDLFATSGAVNGPLFFALVIIGVEGSWFVLTAAHANAAGMSIPDMFRWTGIKVWRLAVLGLPMIGSALVCLYLVFAPLSLVFPDAVQYWLFQDQPVLYAPGAPLLTSLAAFVAICLVAPIAEEWIFRGLLLQRWAAKVGPVRAVVRSSLLFCLMHTDLLGSLIFAVTMAALFARYRTLWAPIIVHVANNSLAFIAAVVSAHTGVAETGTVEELRSDWWLPLIGAVLVLPWLLRLKRVWVPIARWKFDAVAASVPLSPTPNPVMEN